MPSLAEWDAHGVAAARRRKPPARREPGGARAAHGRDRRRARGAGARRPDARRRERADRPRRARRARDSDRRVRPRDRRARPAPRRPASWTPAEISLAEAVAREAAIAIDTSRLLRESDRRVAEQQALLKAGEALTSDLRVEVVIERLVEEIRALVDADAADCWTFAPDAADELVCRAVRRPARVGGRSPDYRPRHDRRGDRHPASRCSGANFATTEQPPPMPNYAGFAEVMDAPIFSFGETLGVLGVCSAEPDRFDESDLPLDRGVREPGLGRPAQRRGVRGEHAADAGRARLLPDRLRAERAALGRGDARRGRAGGGRGARRRLAPPCSAPPADELELAGAHDLAGGLADYLRARGRGADRVRASRQGARVAPAPRRRPLRRGPRARRRAGRPAARCSRSRSRSRRTTASGSCSSSSAARPSSTTTSSSWPGTSRVPRAAHSSGASCTSASAARARSPSGSPGRVASSPASSIRTTCSIIAARSAVELLDADGASIRLLEDDEVVVRAASGAGEHEAVGARTPSTAWLVGDIVQTRSTRAIADVARRPAGREMPTRCSPPATRRISASR